MRKNNGHHGSWRTLPKLAGLKRCGKSCRLRWTNYLNPEIKRGNFTPEEDRIIIQLHGLFGNRWSFIASHLPRRTDNEVKNHWHTHLKKRLPRLFGIQQFLNIATANSAGIPATNPGSGIHYDNYLTGPALMQSILRHLSDGRPAAPASDFLNPKWFGTAGNTFPVIPAGNAASSTTSGRRSWTATGTATSAPAGSIFKDQLEMKAMASSLLNLLGGGSNNNNHHHHFAGNNNNSNNNTFAGNFNKNGVAGMYRQLPVESTGAVHDTYSSCQVSESFNLDLPDELFNDVSNSGCSSHSGAGTGSGTGNVSGNIVNSNAHLYHDHHHYQFANYSHSSARSVASSALLMHHAANIAAAVENHPQSSASCSSSGNLYLCRSGSSSPEHQNSAGSFSDEPIILSELFSSTAGQDGVNQWASLLEKTLLLDRTN